MPDLAKDGCLLSVDVSPTGGRFPCARRNDPRFWRSPRTQKTRLEAGLKPEGTGKTQVFCDIEILPTPRISQTRKQQFRERDVCAWPRDRARTANTMRWTLWTQTARLVIGSARKRRFGGCKAGDCGAGRRSWRNLSRASPVLPRRKTAKPGSKGTLDISIISNGILGGAAGNRTPDLCSAIAALSHLSYSPGPTR
jgi:hypothetical protein